MHDSNDGSNADDGYDDAGDDDGDTNRESDGCDDGSGDGDGVDDPQNTTSLPFVLQCCSPQHASNEFSPHNLGQRSRDRALRC